LLRDVFDNSQVPATATVFHISLPLIKLKIIKYLVDIEILRAQSVSHVYTAYPPAFSLFFRFDDLVVGI
jgi:hypothetical protein